ncbi:hypothetical protein ACLOJK_006658, partial [Asimina triloba]
IKIKNTRFIFFPIFRSAAMAAEPITPMLDLARSRTTPATVPCQQANIDLHSSPLSSDDPTKPQPIRIWPRSSSPTPASLPPISRRLVRSPQAAPSDHEQLTAQPTSPAPPSPRQQLLPRFKQRPEPMPKRRSGSAIPTPDAHDPEPITMPAMPLSTRRRADRHLRQRLRPNLHPDSSISHHPSQIRPTNPSAAGTQQHQPTDSPKIGH